MAKFVWAGALAGVLAGGLGLYVVLRPAPVEPAVPDSSEEQQEMPWTPPFPPGEYVRERGPLPEAADPEETADAIEPIVVEGVVAVAPPSEIGGEAIEPTNAALAVLPFQLPPRPDEEPGQERKMPYADAQDSLIGFASRLWQSLCRLMLGDHAEQPQPSESRAVTNDPAVDAGVLIPFFPPAMGYHAHEPCCPYTGRCSRPHHPVPATAEGR